MATLARNGRITTITTNAKRLCAIAAFQQFAFVSNASDISNNHGPSIFYEYIFESKGTCVSITMQPLHVTDTER